MSEQKSEQKIEQFWRDANAGDIAKVMRGENVEARFRDDDTEHWIESLLQGWRCDSDFEWRGLDAFFCNCQVYEPPRWWLDKPDPGEGWRLLGKFPAEGLQPGDEWFEPDPLEAGWKVSHNERQANFLWYRRRIEPNNPEKLESSRSKDYIPTGWRLLNDNEDRIASDAYWSLGASEWCLIGEDRVNFANRSKWPAIRQIETHKTMQLVLWCQYRLPNGRSIKVTKEGFELL